MNKEVNSPISGIISGIEAQKKSPNRYSIFIEGEFALGLHADLIISENLYKGRELDADDMVRLLGEDAFLKAREKALHLLSYRPRTEREIRDRLRRKGFDTVSADRVIARLTQLDMIDDRRFASSYAEARIRSKGYGPSRIRSDLRAKGVASEIIETAIEQAFADVPLDDLACRAAEKIRRRLETESDPLKRKKKLENFLVRRGFSFDEIRSVSQRFEKK